MDKRNGTTLYEFFEFCLKAETIYETRAEESGMDGDMELCEILNEDAKILKETISKLRNEWRVIDLVGYHIVKEWVNTEITEEQRKVVMDALRTIEQDREYKIKKQQEELNYIGKIISR